MSRRLSKTNEEKALCCEEEWKDELEDSCQGLILMIRFVSFIYCCCALLKNTTDALEYCLGMREESVTKLEKLISHLSEMEWAAMKKNRY